ncbi:hypothetical protein B0H13DRAFT_2391053 [Mycena leptocephala]|nr:hypothetical protein B0H13DRAFT_2391053 [Mycena leptocephala]
MAQVDAGMGRDAALHNDSEAGRSRLSLVCLFPSLPNVLLTIDGSTITLAHLLQHLAAMRVRTMLLSASYSPHRPHLARHPSVARAADTLSENIDLDEALYESADACWDPWVGLDFHLVRALSVLPGFRVAPRAPCSAWRSTPGPSRQNRIEYSYFYQGPCLPEFLRTNRYTLVPSPSTARLLREKGWGSLRVPPRFILIHCSHPDADAGTRDVPRTVHDVHDVPMRASISRRRGAWRRRECGGLSSTPFIVLVFSPLQSSLHPILTPRLHFFPRFLPPSFPASSLVLPRSPFLVLPLRLHPGLEWVFWLGVFEREDAGYSGEDVAVAWIRSRRAARRARAFTAWCVPDAPRTAFVCGVARPLRPFVEQMPFDPPYLASWSMVTAHYPTRYPPRAVALTSLIYLLVSALSLTSNDHRIKLYANETEARLRQRRPLPLHAPTTLCAARGGRRFRGTADGVGAG